MAVDPEDIHAISIALVQLYRDVEIRLATLIASYIRRGIDAPAWMEERLAAIGDLRRAAGDILGQLELDASELLRQYIAEAYRTGWGAALTDIPEPIAAGLAQAAVAEVPRVAAMESLAAALIADVGERHANVLRHVIDVYRATIAQAAALSIGGGVTRLQASQDAYARLTRQGVAAFVDARGRTWRLSSYVEMAVRTVTQRAAVQGQTDRLQTLGLDLVIVSNSPRECPKCLIPGTVVEGPAPTWRTRSEYTGDVISITTAGGKHLTGTPNHPVLTPRGWVRLDGLHPGDQVVSYGGEQRYPGVVPDDVQVPALIEVAGEARAPILLAGPTRRDLDGEAAYCEVRAVLPDGRLLSEVDASFGQPVRDLLLVSGVRGADPLFGFDDPLSVLWGERYAAGGGVRWVEHLGSLLGGGVGPSLAHGFTGHRGSLLVGQPGHVLDDGVMSWPSLDASAAQVVANGTAADAEGGAKLLRALSGLVALDEVVNLSVRQYSGHVWDLSTEPAWFVANGLVTHNCRPWEGKILSISGGGRGRIQVESVTTGRLVTVDVAGSVDDARRAGLQHPSCTHSLRAYLPGATQIPRGDLSNEDGYEAKERQREIERAIRGWKERAAAALTPEAKRAAEAKVRAWQAEMRSHLAANPGLKRLRYREQIGAGNIPRP